VASLFSSSPSAKRCSRTRPTRACVNQALAKRRVLDSSRQRQGCSRYRGAIACPLTIPSGSGHT